MLDLFCTANCQRLAVTLEYYVLGGAVVECYVCIGIVSVIINRRTLLAAGENNVSGLKAEHKPCGIVAAVAVVNVLYNVHVADNIMICLYHLVC